MSILQDKINSLPSLRVTVEAHGLMAKKALGQNFLLDRNITDKIVRLSLEEQGLSNFEGANVFEVGPGISSSATSLHFATASFMVLPSFTTDQKAWSTALVT